MKICTKCKNKQAFTEFWKNKSRPDGLDMWCKTCHILKTNANEAKNKEMHLNGTIRLKDQYQCSDCKEIKLVTEFTRNLKSVRGVTVHCNTCRTKRYRKTVYSLTNQQYLDLLLKQDSKCAICREILKENARYNTNKINIDHCHITNQIRGILCRNCNLGLGYFKDNQIYLNNAINYLFSSIINE